MAFAVIAGAVLLPCAVPLRADEAGKLAKAEELLRLTQGDQMFKMVEPMIKGVAGMVKPDMPAEERARIEEMQRRMMAVVAERFRKAAPALAKVYADTYTEEEIDGILGFYKSPAGKALLEKMPQVVQRSMPVMLNLMGGLKPEIDRIAEEARQKSR